MKLRLTVNVRDLPLIREQANIQAPDDVVTDEEKVAWWLERALTVPTRMPRKVQVIRVQAMTEKEIG